LPITNNVNVANYNGSLLAVHLLSGNNQTLLLSVFGSTTATTVTENNNQLQVGEIVSLGDGRNVEVLGSGTAQPGVQVGFIILPLGTQVPLVLVRDTATNQLTFLYPQGTPNILGAVALIVNLTPADYTFPGGVICFAAGILIATARGTLPVECLRLGMRVQTLDHGLREIVWTGSRTLSAAELEGRRDLCPILIRAGALGHGQPERDLLVSPQHRLCAASVVLQRMFGEPEVLVAAKHLLALPGISQLRPEGGVAYHHIMTEGHDLVVSHGLASETFLPGPQGVRMMSPAARAEVLALFPWISTFDPERQSWGNFAPARAIASGRRARRLIARQVAARKPWVSASTLNSTSRRSPVHRTN
jgi:hypothetical protein